MKKVNWKFWIVVALLLAVAVITGVVSLAMQPAQPSAASQVPRGLQLLGAAVAPVGAIFTTVGVGVALFVAIRDSRRFAKDEERRRTEDTERRADQARLIQVAPVARPNMPPGLTHVSLTVINHSTSPILDVTRVIPESLKERISPAVPAEALRSLAPGKKVLKPGEEWEWAFLSPENAVREAIDSVLIAFTDAAGVRWTRTHDGRPNLEGPRAELGIRE